MHLLYQIKMPLSYLLNKTIAFGIIIFYNIYSMPAISIETVPTDWSPIIKEEADETFTWHQRGAFVLPGEIDFTGLIPLVERSRHLLTDGKEAFTVRRLDDGAITVDTRSTKGNQWPSKIVQAIDGVAEQLEPIVGGVFDVFGYRFGGIEFEDEALGHGKDATILHLDSRDRGGLNAVVASHRPTLMVKTETKFRGMITKSPPIVGPLNDLAYEYREQITEGDLESYSGVTLFGNNSTFHQKPPMEACNDGVRCVIKLSFELPKQLNPTPILL